MLSRSLDAMTGNGRVVGASVLRQQEDGSVDSDVVRNRSLDRIPDRGRLKAPSPPLQPLPQSKVSALPLAVGPTSAGSVSGRSGRVPGPPMQLNRKIALTVVAQIERMAVPRRLAVAGPRVALDRR